MIDCQVYSAHLASLGAEEIPRSLFIKHLDLMCEPERPVEAIYSEDELPKGQEHFLELNAELSQEWPVITEMKDPPPDADEWREVKDKLQYLER